MTKELQSDSSPYNHIYYKLPFTHDHNPITNPMPKNLQNPYFARQLQQVHGFRKSNLAKIAR
jgi:hypothetical protein